MLFCIWGKVRLNEGKDLHPRPHKWWVAKPGSELLTSLAQSSSHPCPVFLLQQLTKGTGVPVYFSFVCLLSESVLLYPLGGSSFSCSICPSPWSQAVHSRSIPNDTWVASTLSWDFFSFSHLVQASSGPPSCGHHPQPQRRGWSRFLAQPPPGHFHWAPLALVPTPNPPYSATCNCLVLAVVPEGLIHGTDPANKVKTDPHVWLQTNVAAERCSSWGLWNLWLLQKYIFTG